MKFIYFFAFTFCSFAVSAQQLAQVCLVNVHDESNTDNDITLQYVVHTIQGSLTYDATKTGDCFTLAFDNIDLNSITSVDLVPNGDVHHLNGVSTFDLVLMVKHILGISNPECTPLEEFAFSVAADINDNGSITTLDVLQLRRLILNLVNTFENNTSWKFFDFDLVNEFVANQSTIDPAFDLNYSMEELQEGVKLLGIKIGDLNAICQ